MDSTSSKHPLSNSSTGIGYLLVSLKPRCRDIVFLTVIGGLTIAFLTRTREDGVLRSRSHNRDLSNTITYDMLFNMHVSRKTIEDGDYSWIKLEDVDVVCLYGKSKEGDSDRNICLLSEQWLTHVKSFTIVTDVEISCPGAKIVHQSTLGVPERLKNPFSVSWFVRFLPLERFILINDDDLLTLNTTKIIDNPLYFRDKLILHNEGDLAQYRVLKKLYSYGGDFIHVPTSPVLHGPMMVYKNDVILAHKLLKLDRLSDCRDGDIWSLTAAVGAIRAIKGEARYAPPNYHYYTQLRSDTVIPSGFLYYCLNDGPELINLETLSDKMRSVFTINKRGIIG